MQSNSSSIEAVFSGVRNARRDTPQGFVTAASVGSSLDGIALLSVRRKRTYDALDIPDESSPAKTNILERNDVGREQAMFLCLRRYEERNFTHSSLFVTVDESMLSSGYMKLKDYVKSEISSQLQSKGFLSWLMKDDDFVGTVKCAMLTTQQPWFEALHGLSSSQEETEFNGFCDLLLSILLQTLDQVAKNKRGSYYYQVFRLISERESCNWRALQDALPKALVQPQESAVPVCLLVLHFADLLLLNVRSVMVSMATSISTANTRKGIKNPEISKHVNRFFGWAIFSLRKKMERQDGDINDGNKKLRLLELMRVLHHEAIVDEEYMADCYAESDQLRNKGGLTLVSKDFFGFGRELMI
jgi:hypothetical protein